MVPPMGLLYLAAVLRERGGVDVRILDLRLEADWRAALDETLRAFQPDAVGISSLTFEFKRAVEVVGAIRAWNPEVRIALGGPHATASPRTALDESGVDAVVVGEGEEIVIPLFRALAEREAPRLTGVLTPGGLASDEPLRPAPAPDVEQLPLPAWDLVHLPAYWRHASMTTLSPWRYAPLITSRGCPWRCTYCHEIHGKRLRTRSIASVQSELERLLPLVGDGAIEILDDNFNAAPNRAKQLLDLFCRTDGRLRPTFPNGVRSDRVDDELLDLMKKSRTEFLSFAIESGNTSIQKDIGKNLDLDAARTAIEGASRRGLYSNGFFMLGFPGETLEQMLETVRFALSVPLVQAMFFRVVPFPGTALWNATRASGAGVSDDYFVNSANVSAVPDRTFAALFRLAYFAFYLRPTQVVRVVRSYPDLSRLSLRVASTLGFLFARRSSHGR